MRTVGIVGTLSTYGLCALYLLLSILRHIRRHDMQAAYPLLILAALTVYGILFLIFSFWSRTWESSLQTMYIVLLGLSGTAMVGVVLVINRRYHDLGPPRS